MLIALLKKLAVPVPIIAIIGAKLIHFKRQRQEKRTAKTGHEAHDGPAPEPTKEPAEPAAKGGNL
jgi:hypothetical protein